MTPKLVITLNVIWMAHAKNVVSLMRMIVRMIMLYLFQDIFMIKLRQTVTKI